MWAKRKSLGTLIKTELEGWGDGSEGKVLYKLEDPSLDPHVKPEFVATRLRLQHWREETDRTGTG